MYCRILPLTIATPRKLDAKTNAPLECRTRWFCSDTTSYLLNHEIKHYIPYGGHKIFISKDEMKAIKDASPAPGISLVGFRPMSALKDHHNLRTGYFLYPDENEMKGATTAFAALHAKMLQHGSLMSRCGGAIMLLVLIDTACTRMLHIQIGLAWRY